MRHPTRRTESRSNLSPVSRREILRALALFPAAAAALSAAESPIRDFHRVTPAIYRGAQPQKEQYAGLAALGIRTVINLRSTPSRAERERRIVEDLGMKYVNIPLRGYRTPPDENIHEALAELDLATRTNSPAFVHCRLGKDRTGTVIACFRIAHQEWSNQDALEEARKLGMSWRQKKMQRYILDFTARTGDSSA